VPIATALDERSQLTVARLTLAAYVPRDRPGAAVVTSDARRFASDELAPALAATLAPLVDSADTSVWVIRCLDLDVAVDASWGAGVVARRLAGAMRAALCGVLSGEGTSAAIRFPDRAAYLASFLADLAEGRAWDRWYYPAFMALRPLPVSSAIRMSLEAHGHDAERALLNLARKEFGRLPLLLTEVDAARILVLLAGSDEGGAPDPRDIEIAAQIVASERRMLTRLAPAAARLALYVKVRERRRGRRTSAAGAAGILLDALHRGSRPDQELDEWDASIGRAPPRDRSEAKDRKRSRDIIFERARVYESASRSTPRRQRVRERPAFATQHTDFAGIFLLWRSIVDLGIDAMLGEACDAETFSARRHLLAIKLAGPDRSDAIGDPALCWLTGYMGPSETQALVQAALAPVDATQGLHERLLDRLAGARPPLPAVMLLESTADRLVLSDPERGDWLWAGDVGASAWRECLAHVVTRFAAAVRESPIIITSATLVELVASALPMAPHHTLLPGGSVAAFHHTSCSPDHELCGRLGTVHGLTRPAGPDLSFFEMGDWPGLDRRADLCWSVVARAAYSDLARRLPGLARSSAAHIWRNVAEGAGAWQVIPGSDEAELRVTLPAAPLRMLLQMSGINEASFRLDGGRRVTLVLGQDSR
jgi:hypothetical protein